MTGPAAILRHIRRYVGSAATDADLLLAYVAGNDPDAFRDLVERHGPLVLAVCRRRLGDVHAAEDAFQATFLALARNAGTVRRPEALAAWLIRAAERVCGRAEATRIRRRTVELQITPRSATEPLADLTARELLAALDAELDRLPERYRLPVWLAYWQGLAHAEAARRLGLSAGAFHGRLERGRRRLAERLRRRGFAPGDLRPLLLAVGVAAVPGDLLARTVGLGAAPWSPTIPAGLAMLVAAPSKLVPAVIFVTLFTGAGLLAFAGGGSPADAPKAAPPIAEVGPAVDRYGDPLPRGAVARLGTLRYRSDGEISHPIVLPDKRQVIFASGAAVVVMDLDTGKIVRRITRTVKGQVSSNPVTALALAPDGNSIAVGCRDFTADGKSPIAFWLGDVRTGAVLRVFEDRDRVAHELAFVAGGQEVAMLDHQGRVTIWNTATGTIAYELTGQAGKLTSLAASADGTTIAAGGAAKEQAAAVYLWGADGKLRRTLRGHTADVQAVAFAPDGRTLASGGNSTVRLWDVATGRELRQFLGHAKKHRDPDCAIRSLAFSADGGIIASASSDWTVRAWAVATGQAMDNVAEFSRKESVLAFRDNHTLLIGGRPALVRRNVVARTFAAQDAPRWSMAFLSFTPDGRSVVTADPESVVRTWNAADGRLLSVNEWSRTTVCTLVSPGGQWAAFSEDESGQAVTCIGDVASGRVVRRFSDKDQYPVCFSADGRRLATAQASRPETPDDDYLTVWDVATGTRVNRFKIGQMSMDSLALAAAGGKAFTAEYEKPFRVRQWDVATGRAVREYALPKDVGAHSGAVSSGGRRLAIECQNGTVHLWDVATGRECWRADTINGRALSVGDAVTFSPDGCWLATDTCGEGQVAIDIWDARTGQHVAAILGHSHQVIRMAFSPDSLRLASTSADGTALVWDVEAATGRRVISPLDPVRQAELWADLAGADGLGAHAIDCLQVAPAAAVTILKQRLRPAVAVPADRIAPFLAGLDNPTFAVRETAQRDLAALGPGAESAVKDARDKANAEVRRRIDAVLAGWDGEQLRPRRAVEVLEYIATPDARKLLGELAAGDPAAHLPRAARAALERLASTQP